MSHREKLFAFFVLFCIRLDFSRAVNEQKEIGLKPLPWHIQHEMPIRKRL